ncbi:Copia protein [Vitis vinifera]|uniref:Copia protein n=1 Tax=Vitis vinifera TaxID=29760 RepID=A0A438DHM7_VITVI|nr:Copia protein [Vitis vinifera]
MTDQFKIDKSIALEEAQIMQKAPEEAHIEQEAPKRHILNKKPPKRHILNKNPEEAQRNENNEIIRYKAQLVAQGFSQRLGIDYEETYSPVMDAITFRFLISLAVSEGLDMHLMDVITAYLYGSIDNDIYMKIPEGFKLPEANSTKARSMYSIKLQRSLYGLKQSGRMWTTDMGLFYSKESKQQLLGYADAGYLSDPHKGFVLLGFTAKFLAAQTDLRFYLKVSEMDKVTEAVEKAKKNWEETLNGLAQDGLALLSSLQFNLDLLAPQLPTDEDIQSANTTLQSWKNQIQSLRSSLRNANLQAKANMRKAAKEERELLLGAGGESTIRRRNLQTKTGMTSAAENITESLRRTRQLMVQEVERNTTMLLTNAVGILYGWSYFVWDLDYVGHGVDHFGLQLNLIMEV